MDRDARAPHTVLLVEDDTPTREHLARIVESQPRLSLVGAASTFAEGLRALDECTPDVLLTDLGLPDGDGTELIRRAGHDTLCMVITVFGDERHVVSAIEAGAMGYLLKDGRADQIAESILDLIAGGSPISAAIARHLLRRWQSPGADAARDRSDAPAGPALTKREHEVLRLVVKGFQTAEIARLMGVSPHTVTTHVRGIYRKLSVSSRGEAVYEALQLGLVKLDE